MNTLQQLNADIACTVADAQRALVRIHNGDGNGAGTIWHAAGLIITNAHVIDPPRRWGRVAQRSLHVTLPGGATLPAHVLASDPARDLAALSVNADNLPTIALGKSRDLRPGDWVMAVGHPWGVAGAVTGGVVIGRGVGTPELVDPAREWIAVSLHMRPGHSGGLLVDVAGRLVGINTMIAGPDAGYAIPLHVVKRFLKQHLTS